MTTTALRFAHWLRRRLAGARQRRVFAWEDGGFDKTLRQEYDLDADSLVLDVGGFEGQWASDIFARYCCRVEIFEPHPAFAKQIERRFARNSRVAVHAFGLAGLSRTVDLTSLGDGSTMLIPSGTADVPTESVSVVAANDHFASAQLHHVDLMKINIEGAEYELLDHLIDTGLIACIRDVQVQFHDIAPESRDRMATLRQRLSHTHRTTYQVDFVWENWRRRD